MPLLAKYVLHAGAGAAFGFALLLMAVGFSSSLPFTLTLLVLMSIVGIVYTASSNSSLQIHTPGPLRGRVGICLVEWRSAHPPGRRGAAHAE